MLKAVAVVLLLQFIISLSIIFLMISGRLSLELSIEIIVISTIISVIYIFKKLNANNSTSYDNFELVKSPIDTTGLSRISLKIPFFNRKSIFFDEDFLYVVFKNDLGEKFPLKDIIHLKATYITINKRRIWSLAVKQNDKTFEFRFLTNISLFNDNFTRFYRKLKELNPEAVQSKLSIFNM